MALIYDVVIEPRSSGIRHFTNKVNDALRDGWKPQGGITANRSHYYQSVIKETPDETNQG